ncbi:MAG: S8/S53 family peptidase [Bacteroidota bacterium]|nr:S8/S53 family peptidase [Bacteroidota bacterium]
MKLKNLLFSFVIGILTCSATIAQDAQLSAYSQKVVKNLHPYIKNPNKSKNLNIPVKVQKEYLIQLHKNVYKLGGTIMVDQNTIDQNELKKLGIEINSKIGNIWTAKIPVQSLELLTKVKGVKYIDLDSGVKKKLDAAKKEAKVDLVQNGYQLPKAYKGKDVVIGIVDMGFDFNHPVFKDTLGNNLRIKRVWDQNGTGTNPTGYTYGAEYKTDTDIKAAVSAGVGSHGTHVSGIAAGSGIVVNNKREYMGVAPLADIVMVNIGNGQSNVLDAVKYIFDYAKSVGKPVVVNMSLGAHLGPHDGKSIQDQGFDALVDKGKILVGAAGNEGNKNLHIKKQFNNISDSIKTLVTFEEGLQGTGYVDIWGSENTDFSVAVLVVDTATGNILTRTDWANTSDTSSLSYSGVPLNYLNDTIYFDFTSIKKSPLNNCPNVQIAFKNTTKNIVALALKSNNSKINMWNNGMGNGAGFFSVLNSVGQIPGFVDGDNESTMGETGGTADSVITVGAYTTTNQYTNIDGQAGPVPFSADLGAIASFSSMGPTVDGRTKPEITAPGNMVISAVNSTDSKFLPGGDEYNYNVLSTQVAGKTFYFGAMAGTSMATPFTTGVIALLLEANPNLSVSAIKNLFKTKSRTDSYTSTIPANGSNIWGWGKISPLDMIKTLTSTTGIDNVINYNNDILIYPNPANDILNINMNLKSENTSELSIINTLGQIVYQENFKNVPETIKSIDVKSLPRGVYLIRINSGEQILSTKLLLQ